MEMRRHARKHSPLQAVCCRPGCSQLFICLWALNLHEREHYASKPSKSDKNTNEEMGDKHDKKQPDHTPTATTAVNKTVTVKSTRKLREAPTETHVQAPPRTSVSASLLKQRKETKHSSVLKNLSNKDTSAQPTGPVLRLRQTLRKVISSSLPKHNIIVRRKFKKKLVKVNIKGPKRRGRPPKAKVVHNENITSGQSSQTIREKNESSNVRNKSKEEEKVKTTDTINDEAKSRKSRYKQMKKNHVKQKGIHSLNRSISTSADKTQRLKPQKTKHTMKKRPAPKENGGQTASSDSSKTKKLKVTNGRPKIVKNPPEEAASVKPAQSVPVVPEVEAKAEAAEARVESSAGEEGKVKAENSVPAVPTDSLNVVIAPPATESGEETQKVTTEETQKVTTEETQKITTEETQEVKTEEKSKKSGVKREGKKEKSSGKTNKKQQDAHKKGDKKTLKEKRPRKDASKTPALKNKVKSKSVDQQIEAKAAGEGATDVEGKANEGIAEATLDGSGSSVINDPISPPAAEQKVTKLKKPKATKSPDPNKASRKRKNVQKEVGAKIAKKKCETENSDNILPNGQATREDVKTTVIDALAEYGKKPYMRPPPTAYLDEKYITMPKRRKELSFLQPYQRSVPLQQTYVAAVLQRQRCANCFATFNTAEDLQSHIELQKCSNDFGFDSDDEGNS